MPRRASIFTGIWSAALLGLASLVAMATPGAARAEVFVSDSHGFRIDFPAEPQVQEGEIAMPSGPAKVISYSAKGGGVRASLSMVRFSRGPFTEAEAAYGLIQSRENQVRQVKGQLLRDTDLTMAGYPGKEIMIGFGPPDKSYRYRGRTYYVGARQFVMSVVGTEREVLAPAATRYLDSFEAW